MEARVKQLGLFCLQATGDTGGFFIEGSMANSGEEQLNDSTKQLNKNGDRRGMSPNSMQNLEKRRSWKKGESGNPQGQSITSRQKEKMTETCPFDGQARTWLESLAEGGMRQALTTPVALSNLQDRTEGKVTQDVTATVKHDVSFVVGRGYVTKD